MCAEGTGTQSGFANVPVIEVLHFVFMVYRIHPDSRVYALLVADRMLAFALNRTAAHAGD